MHDCGSSSYTYDKHPNEVDSKRTMYFHILDQRKANVYKLCSITYCRNFNEIYTLLHTGTSANNISSVFPYIILT